MKFTFIIIIFVIAFIWDALGAFFKIVHLELGIINGNHFLLIGMIGKILGAILLIIKLLKKKES